MDDLDRRIVNTLQDHFPVCERPFRAAAAALGTTEDELIARVDRLLAEGTLTRFGPLFQIERMGGAFVRARHDDSGFAGSRDDWIKACGCRRG